MIGIDERLFRVRPCRIGAAVIPLVKSAVLKSDACNEPKTWTDTNS